MTHRTRTASYGPRMADRICAELALGRSLRAICQADDMPCVTTVMRWLRTRPEFREQYAIAREAQADALADEIVDIADEACDRETTATAKLRIDARKWVAAKLKPKKYGERQPSDPISPSSIAQRLEDAENRLKCTGDEDAVPPDGDIPESESDDDTPETDPDD